MVTVTRKGPARAMCKSKAEGGQRCASHALERVNKTAEAIREDDGMDEIRSGALRAKHEHALTEYASTPQGQVVVMSMYMDARRGAQMDTPTPVYRYAQIAQDGYRLRKENAAVKAGWTRERAEQADDGTLQRVTYGHDPGDDVNVPVWCSKVRQYANPDDATYQTAPVSHYTKATRQAQQDVGMYGLSTRVKENDPAFMRTPAGEECSPRPRNTFHDTTRRDQLDRAWEKARGKVSPDTPDAEAQLDRLRVDCQEQMFCLDKGFYPKYPYPL